MFNIFFKVTNYRFLRNENLPYGNSDAVRCLETEKIEGF